MTSNQNICLFYVLLFLSLILIKDGFGIAGYFILGIAVSRLK